MVQGENDGSGIATGGVAQFIHNNGSYPSPKDYPPKNIGVNSLYLWLSAWLYSLTGNADYFDGAPYNGGAERGGLYQEASWLMNSSGLVKEYSSASPKPSLTTPGTMFLFAGEVDPNSSPTCKLGTGAPETQHMGTAVDALRAMYPAIEKASEQTGSQIPADYTANYASDKTQSEENYLQLADNLAETVIGAGAGSTLVSPPLNGPQFIDGSSASTGVLSETCTSTTTWPDGCDVTGQLAPGNPWLPGKGIFLHSVSCLNADLPRLGMSDSGLGSFISRNAASVWRSDQNFIPPSSSTDVNLFGFLWDNNALPASTDTAWPTSGTQPGQGYATQGSALEALSAYVNQSTAMCDGQLSS